MMAQQDHYPLEIFYDGSCRVCSSEMAHYRRRNPLQRLRFIDISHPEFQAGGYGLSQQQFMAELHVRDAAGRFHTGVDAFLVLWRAFPSGTLYRLFSGLIALPGIYHLSLVGYALFARYRHLLPKTAPECDSGHCNLNHPRA